MEFLTTNETVQFVHGLARNIDLEKYHSLENKEMIKKTYAYPLAQDLFYYSSLIAEHSIVNSWGLFYISEHNIFPSCDNTNLYYSLRKHNGDFRSIDSAPGHLFFKHERHDLASFISVAIANIYDGIILSELDYSRFHLSHDGFLDVYSNNESLLVEFDEFTSKTKK